MTCQIHTATDTGPPTLHRQTSIAKCLAMADGHVLFHDLPAATLRALIREHLKAEDRLQLFRASRPLAHVVVQHASSMGATLGAQKLSQLGHSLIQTADQVHLVLQQNGSLQQLTDLQRRDHIMQLTLQRLDFNAQALQGMRLQTFSNLHSMHLQDCCCWLLPASLQDLAEQYAPQVPPSLHKLRVSGLANTGCSQLWGQFLGSHIKELQCGSLTAMQLLQWLPSVSQLQLDGNLSDQVLSHVLSHSSVQRVAADWLDIQSEDISHRQCNWEQLTLKYGASMLSLSRLPLQGIQQIRVHGLVSCRGCNKDMIQQTIEQLQQYSKVECVPVEMDAAQRVTLRLRSAPAATSSVFSIICGGSLALLQLCNQGLVGEPCTLHLHNMELSEELLPAVPHIPRAVTVVMFGDCHVQDTAGVAVEGTQQVQADQQATAAQAGTAQQNAQNSIAMFWQQLVTLLPHHITHVVLTQGSCRYAAALAAALANGKHQVQLITTGPCV